MAKTLRVGKLRHRVIVQEKNPVRDEYGHEDPLWKDLVTLWGAVEPLRGREFLEQRRDGAELTTRVRIRRYEGITPAMRVKWGDHHYDIVSVVDVETRQREMHLMCREVIDE